ncbi:ATP-dependent Clp protease adaptor ClpS [Lentimicrobium sp.]|jgi:ATP-dependent Clp protease adaptor protein ClpS|uniref:ATP-dependent Clp protease adaptor ClpS n=1 Tax=Lentimicrobium sp. TaxID=2034841 RepID=UPI0025D455F1|nr:ATP-dependent Clp protease adaptor ClpS [Lentimicrobium sp.]MCO5256545.1 ATP-dependent Clp protease adaptor ClpS [Lentimicrobium sp.]MCO5261379.1 ATP-dependent Clp protease adaptor ClpS [Lentimicrobium sp.]HOP12715.1 ATP-dependent Clp protease adaptor ClpS [Lentimicrobium sp.]HPF63897.1 ATP-dependent Clp protease adaptor ClpS [Lentimicrobium sp.]HPJ63162.1 ATP-dependent Clp protease adaptor ClpS [Lentimicrobium sp.]
MVKEKTSLRQQDQSQTTDTYELVLFNDDFNTFDFVIETLIEVCALETVQAEQITLIVHYKGKCGVITGTFNELKPLYNEMINRGLTVSIE